MKSTVEGSWYLPGDGPGRVVGTPATAGPWTSEAQHGGPPAALLGRAVEGLLEPGRTVGRFTLELLGPVPVGPLTVTASVVRPGRTVALLGADLVDEGTGRTVATARAWSFPAVEDGPGSDVPLPHGPDDGLEVEPPEDWHSAGYLASVEWRWITGAIAVPGPATVWMRPRVPLLPGEGLTGLQRLLACVDSASGASAALDPARWTFLNTELTVHVLRPPVGDWVCLSAETTLGTGSVGLATSSVHDLRGLVARSAQALLVAPRG